MADKEATVYVIDLGSTMAACHSGRAESDLDWSMRYVWDKISNTVAASRKTWTVGVVGLRTDETSNPMQEDAGYENISVLQEVGPMTMTSLRDLQKSVKPSGTMGGDAISAIIVAVDMIDRFTKQLKYQRRIILVTDGQAPIDGDDFDDIASKVNDSNIELVVLGVDFDDAEFGVKEEDKPGLKAKNEGYLKTLVGKCNKGVFGTMAEAVGELDTPRLKPVRPYKTYDGPLTLGDPEKYPSAMSINVERYFKTKLARPPAASTVVVKTEPGPGATQSTETLGEMRGVESTGAFSDVKSMRTYRINDPSQPGGKRDVEFDSLAKGYEYGRTAVHISESEHNITKLETAKGFSIVGFIPFSKYEPFLNMGESCITVARKFDEHSEVALSSFIHALYELESYAVARFVSKEGKDPLLLLLMPSFEPDLECLYDVPLPFAEDVRSYQFPPLDKVITVTGSTLTRHRLLPTDDLNEAISDYVDAMDLSTYDVDDEGKPAEYLTIEDSFSPSVHRVNQAIRFRAVHPDKPVPPTAPGLMRFSQPPGKLIEQAKSEIDALVEAAEVKKVPIKAKGKRKRETIKPISGLDVDALLGATKRTKISGDNAVPEFKQLLASAEEMSTVEDAAKQMGAIVRSLITGSTADNDYGRAAEVMRVMREELVALEEPGFYNSFMRDLKMRLLAGELGGDRRDMWWRVRTTGLGLVHQGESEPSDVTIAEAEEFKKSR